MSERTIIIGAGHAAGQCAASLRRSGWEGEILLIGEEAYPPYQRPPLSKAFLSGDVDADRLLFKPDAFYEKENIDLKLSTAVHDINRERKTVALSSGEEVTYTKLVLATGARVRKLPLPGAELAGVGYLRDIADVDKLREKFKPCARISIIGAGYIGLEVAAVAAKMGLEVTVLEAADRVLSRVTNQTVSEFFQKMHQANGVDIRLNAQVAGFAGNGEVERVLLNGNETIDCDIALVGIGVLPNEEIAKEAGLAVDNGILVDEFTATDDADIYAIGDCTRHPSGYLNGMLRLESVHNALEQAKTAAAAICGKPVAYNEAPWFWSDQYEFKLQTVGIAVGRYDQEVIRGDQEKKSFSVFYLKNDQLVAVDSINAPADHMVSRKLIANNTLIDVAKLEDPDTNVKDLLSA